MYKIVFVFLFVMSCYYLPAQTIGGQMIGLAGKHVVLEGYKGDRTYVIGKTKANAAGQFTIPYAQNQFGIGVLSAGQNAQLPVLLHGENIVLSGKNLDDATTVKVTSGAENELFAQYNVEQALRNKALDAWAFLDDLYYKEPFLANRGQALSSAQQVIIDELERLRLQEQQFIQSIPKDSYLSWFLNTKKLITSVETVVKYRPEYAENILRVFRQFNYADKRLYKSGLLGSAVGNYFWLIKNTDTTAAQKNAAAKAAIDQIYAQLAGNNEQMAEMTDFLITLFMQQGLDDFAEYLATKILGEETCTLNDNVQDKLESYRKMKVGNVAPNITFENSTSLYDLQSEQTMVVFWASWCPHCQEEMPKVNTWAKANPTSRVIAISLDDDKAAYETAIKEYPELQHHTDLKKWNGKAVNDYYVYGTPTFILLDKDKTIVGKYASFDAMKK